MVDVYVLEKYNPVNNSSRPPSPPFPLPAREPSRVSTVVLQYDRQWATDVLDEYGVPADRLFSTVSDKDGACCTSYGRKVTGVGGVGAEGRRGESLCVKFSNKKWEWSIEHMLSDALTEVMK